MEAILNVLSSPQKSYPSVHVAGTNGKGSVCAFLSSMLQSQGYRVGRYTSPHLVDLNERFSLNNDPISDAELDSLILFVRDYVESGFELSYFEYTTVIAMEWFRRKAVDIAIFETGLGGRLDATNVITPLVSIITNISFDHQGYLGNSLSEIAFEKAGIIKDNCPVVIGNIKGEALKTISEKAVSSQSLCLELGRDFSFVSRSEAEMAFHGRFVELDNLKPALFGRHQHENCAIAIAAIEEISGASCTMLNISDFAIKTGVESAHWPCRCEFLKNESSGQVVLLDGAHNEDGIRVLEEVLKKLLSGFTGETGLIFACSSEGNDKDYAAMFSRLRGFFKRFCLTEPVGPRKPVTVEMWQGKQQVTHGGQAEKDWERALAVILAEVGPGGFICVSGSLYLIGHVRKKLLVSGFMPFCPK